MATTAQPMTHPMPAGRAEHRRILRAMLLAVLVLAAAALALIVGRVTSADTTAPGSQGPASQVDQQAPARPGGSVYEQQVPDAADAAPGGSVYEQQVPDAADAAPGAARNTQRGD